MADIRYILCLGGCQTLDFRVAGVIDPGHDAFVCPRDRFLLVARKTNTEEERRTRNKFISKLW